MGHCLWTGILDADKADAVARKLVGPDLFSGWGVRTLGASMVGYNPISYHCGSVWPHDNAIVAAGLMRYGYVREAQRVIMAILDAAVAQGGRLPELFSGLERMELPLVVSYPTSVLAAGLGGRLAAADAAHPAAPRSLGAPGQGVAAPRPPRADRPAARGPHPARRRPGVGYRSKATRWRSRACRKTWSWSTHPATPSRGRSLPPLSTSGWTPPSPATSTSGPGRGGGRRGHRSRGRCGAGRAAPSPRRTWPRRRRRRWATRRGGPGPPSAPCTISTSAPLSRWTATRGFPSRLRALTVDRSV